MPYTLRGKISNITPLTLDESLTLEGASADAKAVGDAIQEAKRESKSIIDEHSFNKENPHAVTPAQIGLENVDNTADMDKPVSNKQAEAINEAKAVGTEAQEMATNAQTTADEAKALAQTAQETADKAVTAESLADKHLEATVSLTASGWSGTPYKQMVTLEGIKETDNPHFTALLNGNVSIKEAFALVDELETAEGLLTFTCLGEKPEMDLTILLEVNR